MIRSARRQACRTRRGRFHVSPLLYQGGQGWGYESLGGGDPMRTARVLSMVGLVLLWSTAVLAQQVFVVPFVEHDVPLDPQKAAAAFCPGQPTDYSTEGAPSPTSICRRCTTAGRSSCASAGLTPRPIVSCASTRNSPTPWRSNSQPRQMWCQPHSWAMPSTRRTAGSGKLPGRLTSLACEVSSKSTRMCISTSTLKRPTSGIRTLKPRSRLGVRPAISCINRCQR